MCLSKDEQRKRRRCPSCQKKYSSFILNVTLAEVVERVRQRREWMEGQSRRCDECDSRRPLSTMRRCLSCVRDIGKHVSIGCTLDCLICLECCVDRHNGHEFIAVAQPLSCSSSSIPPAATSTPRLGGTPRYVQWKASTSKGDSRIKPSVASGSLPHKTNGIRRGLPSSAPAIQDDLVFETRSPLYYHITSSFHEVVPNKSSVVRRLSGIIRNVVGSHSSITNQKDSRNYHDDVIRKISSAASGPSIDQDGSMYQYISPRSKNFSRTTCSSELGLDTIERLPLSHYYVNLNRRCSD
ncbi:hypothetical protein RB195_008712 [Necator americanus]